MATEKVGIYRSYRGPVSTDASGQPLPSSEWPKKRAHSWVVRWFGTDGKRYGKSFKNRKEAERFAESKQPEIREGKADPPPRISLRQYAKEHGELMKGNLAHRTLHMHMATISLLARALGWDRKLDTIAARDIERFRAGRLETGISASSANKDVKTLRRIFNLAIMRGYLSQGANPCSLVPMMKVGRKRPPYCSPEEFQALLRFTPDVMWRAFLVAVYTTGMRLREAMNLTWGDIDFAAGEVHVTRKDADGWVQAWTPKDHEMRTIPLPEQAVGLLTAWQPVAPEKCPYVFMEHGRWDYYRREVEAGRWSDGMDLTNNYLRRFQTICRRAGVGPYTIHDLRRSCITNWARQLPIHVVQQLAGHSDIKTTQLFYLSVQPDDVARAKSVQQSLLGELPAGATDQKLTNSGKRRCFPGRKSFWQEFQPAAKA